MQAIEEKIAALVRDPSLQEALEASRLAKTECRRFIDTKGSRDDETMEVDSGDTSSILNNIAAYLVKLRHMNRDAMLTCKSKRAGIAERKALVDERLLQLQNLHYQQQHLRGEIKQCEDYPSIYNSLPLIGVEDFKALAEVVPEGPHELMLARLQHEETLRQELENHRRTLVLEKAAIEQDNAKHREKIESLDRKFQSLIDMAGPIEQILQSSL